MCVRGILFLVYLAGRVSRGSLARPFSLAFRLRGVSGALRDLRCDFGVIVLREIERRIFFSTVSGKVSL